MEGAFRIPAGALHDHGARAQLYLAGPVAGLLGTLVFMVFFKGFRILQLTMVNPSLILGTLLTGEENQEAWLLGVAMLCGLGMLLGSYYAVGFVLAKRTGFLPGAVFGVLHWLVAGVALGLLTEVHPLSPGVLTLPGFFAIGERVSGALVFFLAHLVFGAVTGEAHSYAVRQRLSPEGTRLADGSEEKPAPMRH